MGLFKRKSKEITYEQLLSNIEREKGELSQIISKKRSLERRLEILTRAKPSSTIIINTESDYTPRSSIELDISYIMTQLNILDQEEDEIRTNLDYHERYKRYYDNMRGDKKRTSENMGQFIKVKNISDGKDLTGEVFISQDEANRGTEKVIECIIDGKKRKAVVKIPSGVKEGSRIRFKGMGAKGNPSGNLYLTVRININ
jgi:hypothetical protein